MHAQTESSMPCGHLFLTLAKHVGMVMMIGLQLYDQQQRDHLLVRERKERIADFQDTLQLNVAII
eukprot:4364080-Amphidinium_carterae.1